ncbi:MAG: hypothetical protein COV67_13465 [Nitrospinae bacterium CG11_big_fil_rev_8_21_14_0_20_56_8]|nr:MAG: hypothetical protein COV67_13465 [Nitrospinae bacterium CG11_big_fil_rev_8_21_14_0_20_56_8]
MAFERKMAFEKDPLPEQKPLDSPHEPLPEKLMFGIAVSLGALFLLLVLYGIFKALIQFMNYLSTLLGTPG